MVYHGGERLQNFKNTGLKNMNEHDIKFLNYLFKVRQRDREREREKERGREREREKERGRERRRERD